MPSKSKDNNGNNKLLAILLTVMLTTGGGAVTWLRSDISSLKKEIALLRVDNKDIKDLINGSNITAAELVKDVNINTRDITYNRNEIEELKR